MSLQMGHHRPASETPFKCWLGSFVIFQGTRTSIAKKPYIFVIFQGGGRGGPDHLSPSGQMYHICPYKHTVWIIISKF